MTDTRNIDDTINNALDGDVAGALVQAATDNGWWMNFVDSVNGLGTVFIAGLVLFLTWRQTSIASDSKEIAASNLKLAEANKETDEARRRHELFDRRYAVFAATIDVLEAVVFGSTDDFEKAFGEFSTVRLKGEFYFDEKVSNRLARVHEKMVEFRQSLKWAHSDDEDLKRVGMDECLEITNWAETEMFDDAVKTEFAPFLMVDFDQK